MTEQLTLSTDSTQNSEHYPDISLGSPEVVEDDSNLMVERAMDSIDDVQARVTKSLQLEPGSPTAVAETDKALVYIAEQPPAYPILEHGVDFAFESAITEGALEWSGLKQSAGENPIKVLELDGHGAEIDEVVKRLHASHAELPNHQEAARAVADAIDALTQDVSGLETTQPEHAGVGAKAGVEIISSPTPERRSLDLGGSVELPIGNSMLEIINQGDRELLPADLDRIETAYSYVDRVLGEKASSVPYKLHIVGAAVGMVLGHADRASMSVDLQSKIFDFDARTERSRQQEDSEPNRVDSAVDTIIHEMGHIVDFAATESQLDKQSDPHVITDFFDDDAIQSANILSLPFRSKTDISDMTVRIKQAGIYQDRRAGDVYGEGVTVEAPTSYAKKTPSEYFAECFRRYALGGTLDAPLKDAVQAVIDCDIPNPPR